MLQVYEWLVYIIMRPHKSFQHLIKWFGIFIRAKTNSRKRKERLNRKELENPYLSPRAEPAQPAHPAHQGHGGLLPPPAHPSCSVECHRASRGRHVVVDELPALPVASSRTWTRLETP